MAIRLKLEGVDDLLKKIEEADGNVEQAAVKCMKESAEIMQTELKSAMRSTKGGVSESLINRMPEYTIENKGNRVTAHVGYKATSYNPNDLSDYHKAIFANYGTPHRRSHGIEKVRGFVEKAKKAAKPKIEAQQNETLNDIIKDLT